jgi:hypothetical protein
MLCIVAELRVGSQHSSQAATVQLSLNILSQNVCRNLCGNEGLRFCAPSVEDCHWVIIFLDVVTPTFPWFGEWKARCRMLQIKTTWGRLAARGAWLSFAILLLRASFYS